MPTNASSFPIGNTSFTNPMQTTNRSRLQLSETLKQFCSYLFEILIKKETALTVKQFLQIENRLCTEYHVDSFAAFKFDGNDTDDTDVNLVSFLDTHQNLIDPNRELSVYGYNVPVSDRKELFEFVNQLIESNSDRQNMSQQTIQSDGDPNDEDIQLTADNLTILEKVVIRKFGGLLGFRTGINILRKSKESYIKDVFSIIR
jgi:hypothetical protein